MYLYLFNPDNDLALGNNSPYYQPPASARQMAADLAVLPAWVAPCGESMVAVSGKESAEAWTRGRGPAPSIRWVTLDEGVASCHAIRPWGWNAALVRALKRLGAGEDLLPAAGLLAELRRLSSRQRAVEVMAERPRDACFCGASQICRSLDEIDFALQAGSPTGRMLLKAPWSGSGKGLRWVDGTKMDGPARNWCAHVLAKQEAVVVEPGYRRVADVALEFYAAGGKVSFFGYSLFLTDENGAYRGNRLLSDRRIEEELEACLPVGTLAKARQFLLGQLGRLLPSDYDGCLGVDMMVCRFEDEPCFRLHPCVEINLRMNMGVVAHGLYSRWLSPASEGIFRIDSFSAPTLLQADHEQQQSAHPLVMRDGRIVSGYVSLVPVGATTRYRAAVWVHPVSG